METSASKQVPDIFLAAYNIDRNVVQSKQWNDVLWEVGHRGYVQNVQ